MAMGAIGALGGLIGKLKSSGYSNVRPAQDDYGRGASGYIDSPTSGDRINYSVEDEDEFYRSLLGHYQEMGPDGQMYNMRRMAPNMWINADMFPTDDSWRNYQESSVEINPSNVDNKLIEDRIGEGVGQNFRRGY